MPNPARPMLASLRFSSMPPLLAVLAGGLLGSAARATIASVFPNAANSFPVTTLAINIAGSLLLGFYLVRRQRAVVRTSSLRFWAIGALGSFTTFSTFSVEVVRLIDAEMLASAIAYVGASTLGGLAAAVFGGRLGSITR